MTITNNFITKAISGPLALNSCAVFTGKECTKRTFWNVLARNLIGRQAPQERFPMGKLIREFPKNIEKTEQLKAQKRWHGGPQRLWGAQLRQGGIVKPKKGIPLYVTKNMHQAGGHARKYGNETGIILEIGVFRPGHEIWHHNPDYQTFYLGGFNYGDVGILRAYQLNPNYFPPSLLENLEHCASPICEILADSYDRYYNKGTSSKELPKISFNLALRDGSQSKRPSLN